MHPQFLSYLLTSYLRRTEKHDRAYWCLCERINNIPETVAYTAFLPLSFPLPFRRR